MRTIGEVSSSIVRKIWNDMSDRRGLGDALDMCDDEIKKEIRKEWREIVNRELIRGIREATNNGPSVPTN